MVNSCWFFLTSHYLYIWIIFFTFTPPFFHSCTSLMLIICIVLIRFIICTVVIHDDTVGWEIVPLNLHNFCFNSSILFVASLNWSITLTRFYFMSLMPCATSPKPLILLKNLSLKSFLTDFLHSSSIWRLMSNFLLMLNIILVTMFVDFFLAFNL